MGLEESVVLGRSGLRVGRLGISSSYGMEAADVVRAVEAGMNYVYWGSIRREAFAEGIRQLSPRRESFALVLQSYGRFGFQVRHAVEKGLRVLRLTHADVLLLGWWNRPVTRRVLDAALELRGRGLIRHVAVSSHARAELPGHARQTGIDILHLRYNAEHPGAEQDVFPQLPSLRPGVVAYTATSWKRLLDPAKLPPGERAPTAGDCYRFALSHPAVDVCLTGLANAKELDHALRARERGPMDEDELTWMRRVGRFVAGYS